MLIATFTALYLLFWASSSGSTDPNLEHMATLIKSNVEDKTRREQALQIVAHMQDVNKAHSALREKVANSLAKLIGNRTTPPAAIEDALNPLIADDKTTREQILDLRFQLKSVLTAKEWGAVFTPPKAGAAPGTKKMSAISPAAGHRT